MLNKRPRKYGVAFAADDPKAQIVDGASGEALADIEFRALEVAKRRASKALISAPWMILIPEERHAEARHLLTLIPAPWMCLIPEERHAEARRLLAATFPEFINTGSRKFANTLVSLLNEPDQSVDEVVEITWKYVNRGGVQGLKIVQPNSHDKAAFVIIFGVLDHRPSHVNSNDKWNILPEIEKVLPKVLQKMTSFEELKPTVPLLILKPSVSEPRIR